MTGDWPEAVRAESGLDPTTAYDDPGLTDVSDQAREALEAASLVTFESLEHDVSRSTADSQPCERSTGAEFLVHNMDKGEVLRAEQFGQRSDFRSMLLTGGDGGITTALTVLLAGASRAGGRGGGDFRGDSPMVGSWAGDRLQVVLPLLVVRQERVRDISAQCRQMLADGGEAAYRVHTDGQVARLAPPWAN